MKYLILVLALSIGCGCELQQLKDHIQAEQPTIVEDTRLDDLIDRVKSLQSQQDATIETINGIISELNQLNKIVREQTQAKSKPESIIEPKPTVKEKAPKPFTGAVVYVSLDGSCPACTRLMRDFKTKAVTSKGWTIGYEFDNHFVISREPPKVGGVPQIVYYISGSEVLTIEGYNGNLKEILINHPTINKNPGQPRAKARRQYQAPRYSTVRTRTVPRRVVYSSN